MSNWISLTYRDLYLVLSQQQVQDADENTESGSVPGDDLDYSGATRSKDLVAAAIELCRNKIQGGGRYPLSITPSLVPPDAKEHLLNWAAYKLLAGKPSLVTALMAEKSDLPFSKDYKAACDYLEALGDVTSKVNVVLPDDPTGQDYLTAVSDSNPAIHIISWSDQYATDEEYEAGQKTISTGYVVPVAPLDLNVYI